MSTQNENTTPLNTTDEKEKAAIKRKFRLAALAIVEAFTENKASILKAFQSAKTLVSEAYAPTPEERVNNGLYFQPPTLPPPNPELEKGLEELRIENYNQVQILNELMAYATTCLSGDHHARLEDTDIDHAIETLKRVHARGSLALPMTDPLHVREEERKLREKYAVPAPTSPAVHSLGFQGLRFQGSAPGFPGFAPPSEGEGEGEKEAS